MTTQTTLDEARAWLNNWQDIHPKVSAIIRRLVAEIEAERGENNRLRGEVERLGEALTVIVDGKVPTQHQNGYYLAHRNAVYVARAALAKGDA